MTTTTLTTKINSPKDYFYPLCSAVLLGFVIFGFILRSQKLNFCKRNAALIPVFFVAGIFYLTMVDLPKRDALEEKLNSLRARQKVLPVGKWNEAYVRKLFHPRLMRLFKGERLDVGRTLSEEIEAAPGPTLPSVAAVIIHNQDKLVECLIEARPSYMNALPKNDEYFIVEFAGPGNVRRLVNNILFNDSFCIQTVQMGHTSLSKSPILRWVLAYMLVEGDALLPDHIGLARFRVQGDIKGLSPEIQAKLKRPYSQYLSSYTKHYDDHPIAHNTFSLGGMSCLEFENFMCVRSNWPIAMPPNTPHRSIKGCNGVRVILVPNQYAVSLKEYWRNHDINPSYYLIDDNTPYRLYPYESQENETKEEFEIRQVKSIPGFLPYDLAQHGPSIKTLIVDAIPAQDREKALASLATWFALSEDDQSAAFSILEKLQLRYPSELDATAQLNQTTCSTNVPFPLNETVCRVNKNQTAVITLLGMLLKEKKRDLLSPYFRLYADWLKDKISVTQKPPTEKKRMWYPHYPWINSKLPVLPAHNNFPLPQCF